MFSYFVFPDRKQVSKKTVMFFYRSLNRFLVAANINATNQPVYPNNKHEDGNISCLVIRKSIIIWEVCNGFFLSYGNIKDLFLCIMFPFQFNYSLAWC